MQKLKKWKSKIKLQNLLGKLHNYSDDDREKALWFMTERERFKAAIERKKGAILASMVICQGSKDHGEIRKNKYFLALEAKLKELTAIYSEVNAQQKTLAKIIAS